MHRVSWGDGKLRCSTPGTDGHALDLQPWGLSLERTEALQRGWRWLARDHTARWTDEAREQSGVDAEVCANVDADVSGSDESLHKRTLATLVAPLVQPAMRELHRSREVKEQLSVRRPSALSRKSTKARGGPP